MIDDEPPPETSQLYRQSLALLTDLYQLTMAHGYWRQGKANQQATFHLFFRKSPFQGGYAIAAGLQTALDILRTFKFDQSDLDYLRTLTGNDQQPLFDDAFIDVLGSLRLSCRIDAVLEGTVVFPNEPLVRVSGPILQCQILETMLLNIINFQTLITTKAARITDTAGDDGVLEFGLRRAQGIDGSLSATRAAYIGGCVATSNVLAGKLFGIPVRGTHAHSWVMSFDTEAEAFAAYADAMPNNCVFLVDTYDTLEGVRRAVDVGKQLRTRGHKMVGIRLDSGDLAYLSMEARKILDEGGFTDAKIVASNDLDEYTMESLKHQGAQITLWGVGTKLATAYDQPALGGVYKLGAMQDADGVWQPKIKLSEQLIKTSIPGRLQVRRYRNRNGLVADMIYDEQLGIDSRRTIVDPLNPTTRFTPPIECDEEDLLVNVFANGEITRATESIHEIRERAKHERPQLHTSIRRLLNPHRYPVGMDIGLNEMRDDLIQRANEA